MSVCVELSFDKGDHVLMRRVVSAAIFVMAVGCIGATRLVAQQTAPESIQVSDTAVTFPPMSGEFLDHFFDSLRARGSFLPPPLQRSQNVDANTSGMWAGTKTSVDTDLEEVVLRFTPKNEARLEQAANGKEAASLLAEQFDVTLQVTPRKLTIIHPLAEGKATRRGISTEYSEFERASGRVEFVRGFRDAGIYFAVPSMTSNEAHQAWGILVCPRRYVVTAPKRGTPSRPELHPSPYELSEVRMTWRAQIEASFSAGNKKERVAVELALSQHLPRSIDHRDEVVALSPMIPLTYKPVGTFDFFRMPQDGSVQEGILTAVELQNFAGYVRKQYFSHVGYVKRIDEPSPVAVIVKANQVFRDEGTCYAVASQRSVWSRYDRQAPPQ